ncbi:MAG: serine hydrolase [Actinomycetota bacterium]
MRWGWFAAVAAGLALFAACRDGGGPPAPSTSATADGYDFSAIGPIVAEFVGQRGLEGAGLVVVDAEARASALGDGIVHEEYWGGFDANRVSLIASASKPITTIVLLQLAERGLLDLDAPISDLTGWEVQAPMTTAQLLSNSSGLVGIFRDEDDRLYRCRNRTDGTLLDCGREIATTQEDAADVRPPDTSFDYGGGQWHVAGAVAEAVSGRSWASLVADGIAGPCGLESLAFTNPWIDDGSGGGYPHALAADPPATQNPNVEGGARSTARDYAQILLLHLRGGLCGTERILSPASIDRMLTDRIAEVYGGDAYEPDRGYGLGWWIDRTTGRRTAEGAWGAWPWLDLDGRHGAYLVIEADTLTGRDLVDRLYDPVANAVLAGR